MNSLLHTLAPLILICLGGNELLKSFFSTKKKDAMFTLLELSDQKKNVSKKQVNKRHASFENIIAKNSLFFNFLRRFQTQNSWRMYAVFIGFLLFFLINRTFALFDLSITLLVVIFVLIGILIIFMPEFFIKRQTARRIKMISRDLPLIIDMMAIMIRSGMTIESSFKYLSSRVKPINKDVASIFERACVMMEVNGIEQSIDLIQRDVPSKEMRMFCVTLRRSINFGNSIYETLLELSTEMREIQRLTLEEKIAALAAKLTIPMILLFLLPVIAIIGGPVFISILLSFSRVV